MSAGLLRRVVDTNQRYRATLGALTREWRNGIRDRFRFYCPKGRGGSTPPSRTLVMSRSVTGRSPKPHRSPSVHSRRENMPFSADVARSAGPGSGAYPPALLVSDASTSDDAFEKRAFWQDQPHEKDRSSYCDRRCGRFGSVGVRDHRIARHQPRGLCHWHRMVGSGRQRVPSDRCPYEELPARRLVGSHDCRLSPVLAPPPAARPAASRL